MSDEGVNAYRRRKRDGEENIFGMLDSYDAGAFYLGAVDDKGHGRAVKTLYPPDVVTLMENIVASRQWPYRNNHQLIRDAVVHHCKWLSDNSMDIELQQRMARVITNEALSLMEQDLKANVDLVDKARALGEIAVRNRDWVQLSTIADRLADAVDGIHEPYQTQLSKMIDDYRAALPKGWNDTDD